MQKIKYGAIEITVRRATVRDDLNAQVIAGKLQQGVAEGTWGLWTVFAELCSQTVKAKGLPFDPTSLSIADSEALGAAYDSFLDLDKALKDLWKKAVDAESQPVDETLGPVPLPDNADPN